MKSALNDNGCFCIVNKILLKDQNEFVFSLSILSNISRTFLWHSALTALVATVDRNL